MKFHELFEEFQRISKNFNVFSNYSSFFQIFSSHLRTKTAQMSTNSQAQANMPWFRVHIVILNDPGRLISVHQMHSGFVAGWSGVMLCYELITVDATDPVYNPIWRQGCYGMPFISRIGVIGSLYSWSLGIKQSHSLYWTYETINTAHILLSGSCILAAFWHWAYWDLNVFVLAISRKALLDLNQIIGIHLLLASLLCLGFGLAHLSGFLGPGMWTSDEVGVVGSIRFVKPAFNLIGLAPFCYGIISSHHIIAGFFGTFIGTWHISSRPGLMLYKLLKMGNVEEVLSSSIPPVFLTAFVISALMWYGSSHCVHELFGPSRYHWDSAYFAQELERRVKSVQLITINSQSKAFTAYKAWEQVADKLVLYDYIGCNPSKGGLFRSGAMLKGDGVVQNWLGHASFSMGTLSLAIRLMPAFFETFPVILIDQTSTVRADIAFRRGSSCYSMEQTRIILQILGGILNGTEYSTPSLVKDYARKAQFGSIFTFDRITSTHSYWCDGVLRTSPRGWYSFSHTAFASCFFFGHLWHASRAVFQDIWTGVSIESRVVVEYGRNEKLGDKTTKASTFI
jgi:photosystem II CP47 chlorophyll apoprotein